MRNPMLYCAVAAASIATAGAADAQTYDIVPYDVVLAERLAKRSFDELDADGNGAIDRAERAAEPLLTERRFIDIDSDHNGTVDRFEFAAFKEQIASAAARDVE